MVNSINEIRKSKVILKLQVTVYLWMLLSNVYNSFHNKTIVTSKLFVMFAV